MRPSWHDSRHPSLDTIGNLRVHPPGVEGETVRRCHEGKRAGTGQKQHFLPASGKDAPCAGTRGTLHDDNGLSHAQANAEKKSPRPSEGRRD